MSIVTIESKLEEVRNALIDFKEWQTNPFATTSNEVKQSLPETLEAELKEMRVVLKELKEENTKLKVKVCEVREDNTKLKSEIKKIKTKIGWIEVCGNRIKSGWSDEVYDESKKDSILDQIEDVNDRMDHKKCMIM